MNKKSRTWNLQHQEAGSSNLKCYTETSEESHWENMLGLITDAYVGRETVKGCVVLLSTNLLILSSNSSIFNFCIQIKMPMTKEWLQGFKNKTIHVIWRVFFFQSYREMSMMCHMNSCISYDGIFHIYLRIWKHVEIAHFSLE